MTTAAADSQASDPRRLAILHSYAILDTPPDPALDDLAETAAAVCGTPAALVSLVDRDRQWFKAHIRFPVRESPLDRSFCAHAIENADLMVVPDARKDSRFREFPNVRGEPHIRFYAGVPLVVSNGAALGTLCVVDYEPRTLEPWQEAALRALARSVVTHLELRKAAQTLREAERAKGDLLDILAHELLGALTPITGYAYLARHEVDGGASKALASHMERLERATAGMVALVRDVGELARIQGDRLRVNKATLDLRPVLEDAAQAYEVAARERGVRVEVEDAGEAGELPVHADRARIEQVLANLVSNAIKHAPPGATVRLRASRDHGEVAVRVSDTGSGLTLDEIARLFHRFAQLDNRSPRDAYTGNGLGLYICQDIVRQHGGRIWAESEGRGKGATFAFTLPLAAGAD